MQQLGRKDDAHRTVHTSKKGSGGGGEDCTHARFHVLTLLLSHSNATRLFDLNNSLMFTHVGAHTQKCHACLQSACDFDR